jgi:thymidylate synthase (FAD)
MVSDKINVLDKGYVRLVDHMGTDLSIVNAARVSYDKESQEFNERDDRLLSFLLEHGHDSPLRHATLTFEVYAPLMVARQWWKYAVGSTHIDDSNGWNESSRRYVTENEEFYRPNVWRSAPENSKQGSGGPMDADRQNYWTHALIYLTEAAEIMYEKALNEGMAPELARLFLPANGLYVRWRWTTSLAATIHFLQQRLKEDAQYEIQEYARAVEQLTLDKFPKTLKAASNA